MDTVDAMQTTSSELPASENAVVPAPWRSVVRVLWVIGFCVVTVSYALGLLAVHGILRAPCEVESCTLREQVRHTETGEEVLRWPGPPIGYGHPLNVQEVQVLESLGLTLEQYAVFWALELAIPILIYLMISAMLFWRKPDDWMVLFVSVMVATFPFQEMPVPFTLIAQHPVWEWVYIPGNTIALSFFLIFPLVFPTGRFVLRWTRWLALFILVGAVFITVIPDALGPAIMVYLLTSFVLGVYAQIYRYFRVAGPAERQQIKWVVVGIITFMGVGIPLTLVFQTLVLAVAGDDLTRTLVLSSLVDIVFRILYLAIPASIAISALRYRLWDIDIIIRRTLTYGAITLTLGATYFAVIALLQRAVVQITGQQSPLAVVVSTLAIAALFTPLRNRVQAFVDRRFFRRKYDAERTLEAFAESLRDEVDIEHLQAALVSVVEETMQPESVSLWVRKRRERKS